jgi:phosphoadenosine phosphosulfate reductase
MSGSPTTTAPRLSPGVLESLNSRFEDAPAAEIVRWAATTFGDGLVLTASMTDAVLIDVATRVAPDIEVVFLDTGYHFPETLETAARVQRRYRLELTVISADLPRDGRWRTDPDGCCAARKVAPLNQLLARRTAWMSGLRRADGPDRAEVPVVAHDRRGVVKVNPLATWSDEDVNRYITDHDVPVNPLVAEGFPSIGCWPCTWAVDPGGHPRDGRWAGQAKTECGLHLAVATHAG